MVVFAGVGTACRPLTACRLSSNLIIGERRIGHFHIESLVQPLATLLLCMLISMFLSSVGPLSAAFISFPRALSRLVAFLESAYLAPIAVFGLTRAILAVLSSSLCLC
jgi:hypothetical protein